MPPNKVRKTPIRITLSTFSRKKMTPKSVTHIGVVQTITTELAMVVYSRDVIQDAKWIARNKPANKDIKRFFLDIFLISGKCLNITTGISGMVENIILAAAMTKEFTSFWANRINIAAAEILITPKNNMMNLTLLLSDAFFDFLSKILLITGVRSFPSFSLTSVM